MILLISVLYCWMKVECAVDSWYLDKHKLLERNKDKKEEMPQLYNIISESVFIVTQTVMFLTVQFFITVVDGMISEQHFAMEEVVLPARQFVYLRNAFHRFSFMQIPS